eukprot:TRINITY_DN12209_c0_g1_i1.p1 TRINITY_DN12209_c0_g1~~TRINITY_DN12209_c0_g1_i1.p1  ORF type:complete len:139 (+),score=20.36 TRINITY_DN12209_c0_g1_i1:70-486(+)
MATNSLRGGKNIYGPRTLISNYFEEQLEPKNQQEAQMCQEQLPCKTAKTWTRTSDCYGGPHKDAMRRKLMGNPTGDWLNYGETDPSVHYATSTGSTYCHPSEQVPAFKAPYIPEEKLQEYRGKWTKAPPRYFELGAKA